MDDYQNPTYLIALTELLADWDCHYCGERHDPEYCPATQTETE